MIVEEVLNVITHGSGCVASIVGTPFLLKRAWRVGDEVRERQVPNLHAPSMSSSRPNPNRNTVIPNPELYTYVALSAVSLILTYP